ncbi:MAG: DUF1611 domain-containing protein [Pseudomonadota bacterium]
MTNTFPRAKWCFSSRRIDPSLAHGLDKDWASTKPGDMILGRIISIGQHARIQLPTGRPSTLYPGDLVAMPCGARYAPDQFEGLAEIDPKGCDMLAGGGCLGRMVHRNARRKEPTRVQPLGRILDADGKVINTADYGLPAATSVIAIPIVAVFGTAMNSGKTTAAVALSHGLTKAGWQVGALKGTGTGAFGDFNDYVDTGAAFVADFTDAGMATTYMEPLDRLMAGIIDLVVAAQDQGCDIAVLEIADGLFQRETAALLADPAFKSMLSGVIFACGDALAASGGVASLARNRIRPLALTGMLSCSPMATEEARLNTGIEVLTRQHLLDPAEANRLATLVSAKMSAAAA